MSDLRDLLAVPAALKVQLRAANPINVQPKHAGTRLQLEKWLGKAAPAEQAVRWDADAPFGAGQAVGQHYDFAMAARLSDDLQLDELRCLELIAQVVLQPEVRRLVEEERELGAGTIELVDSPYYAALELFYLERGFLTRALKELMVLAHPASQALSADAKADLRSTVARELLDGGALARGLASSLVALTQSLRQTEPKTAGADTWPLVRRREFLRSERLQVAEALFYACHSFGVEGCGPALPGLLVAAAKALALDQAFFDAKGPTELDDGDDRPGLVRCLGLVLLALMHVLESDLPAAATHDLRRQLGVDLAGDGVALWESEGAGSGPGDDVSGAFLKILAARNCVPF